MGKLNELNETATNVEIDALSVNRGIKDGVFKLLFEKPENAAELYHALTGVKCDPNEIQIFTITTLYRVV